MLCFARQAGQREVAEVLRFLSGLWIAAICNTLVIPAAYLLWTAVGMPTVPEWLVWSLFGGWALNVIYVTRLLDAHKKINRLQEAQKEAGNRPGFPRSTAYDRAADLRLSGGRS